MCVRECAEDLMNIPGHSPNAESSPDVIHPFSEAQQADVSGVKNRCRVTLCTKALVMSQHVVWWVLRLDLICGHCSYLF